LNVEIVNPGRSRSGVHPDAEKWWMTADGAARNHQPSRKYRFPEYRAAIKGALVALRRAWSG